MDRLLHLSLSFSIFRVYVTYTTYSNVYFFIVVSISIVSLRLTCTTHDYLALLAPTRSDYGKFLFRAPGAPSFKIILPLFPSDSRLFYLLVWQVAP